MDPSEKSVTLKQTLHKNRNHTNEKFLHNIELLMIKNKLYTSQKSFEPLNFNFKKYYDKFWSCVFLNKPN